MTNISQPLPPDRAPGLPARRRRRGRPGRFLATLALSAVALGTLLPLGYVLNLAFLGQQARMEGAVLAIPPDFDTVGQVWRAAAIPSGFYNSLIYSGGTVIVLWLTASLAAYAGTKMAFRGREFVLFGIVLFVMLPFQTILYPLFALVRDLGWINRRYGVILVMAAFGLPLTTFQFAAYFRTLPNELVEAGKIDGASSLQILFRVILPMSGPVLALTGVSNALWTWNALLIPLILITKRDQQTMIVNLAQLQGIAGFDAYTGAAVALIGMVPTLAFFLVAQRAIITGVAAGAVRG